MPDVGLYLHVKTSNNLLVLDYVYSLGTGTSNIAEDGQLAWGPSKESAMFIGLVIVIILLAAYVGFRLRRHR